MRHFIQRSYQYRCFSRDPAALWTVPWLINMLRDDTSKQKEKKRTILNTVIIHSDYNLFLYLNMSPRCCFLTQRGVRHPTDTIDGVWIRLMEGGLSVSDWLVKAPAKQGNGMMCSYLECKLEIIIIKKNSMCVCVCRQNMMLSHCFLHKHAMTSSWCLQSKNKQMK